MKFKQSMGEADQQGIIEPMRTHEPPLISPEIRLHAFVNEVFSTIPDIFVLQEQMLERLLERQRLEWPIVSDRLEGRLWS